MITPSVGHAQISDDARAQELYEAARTDYDNKAFKDACPKFESALKLKPDHLRTAIALANCYDKVEKTASAWELLETTRQRAIARADQKKVDEIDGLLVDLKSRLSRIRINVPQYVRKQPRLTILRDNVPVPPAQWGESIPVNPGRYKIEASASDKETWSSKEYDVPIGESVDVSVTPNWNLDEGQESRATSGRVIAGIVGIGIGAVLFIPGSYYGVKALEKRDESRLDDHCDAADKCDDIGRELRLEAQDLGNNSTIFFAVGGALIVGGIVLAATAPKSTTRPNGGVQASLWLGPGNLGIRGRW